MDETIQRDVLNPYPWYRSMRSSCPVAYNSALHGWEVFRYDDVLSVMNSPAVFTRSVTRDISSPSPLYASLFFLDPPRHRSMRALVSKAFSPKRIAEMEPRIRSMANSLLDQVIETGNMDAIQDFTYPLPVMVIAEMIGIPPEDRAEFRHWSDAAIAGILSPHSTPEQQQEMARMYSYFQHIIEKRKKAPQDDIISSLLEAKVEGERLTDEEIQGFCALLLVAGNETTMYLLSNAFLYLDEYPEMIDQIKADPSLLPKAIEEMLRHRSPIHLLLHTAVVDTEVAGQPIKAGERVMANLGSANRDETQFNDPDTFDITRSPNHHVAFGLGGIHFCLGAPLTRLEAKVALSLLLERLGEIRRQKDIPLVPANVLASGVSIFRLPSGLSMDHRIALSSRKGVQSMPDASHVPPSSQGGEPAFQCVFDVISMCFFIEPRRKTPIFRYGDRRRVPCLGLGQGCLT